LADTFLWKEEPGKGIGGWLTHNLFCTAFSIEEIRLYFCVFIALSSSSRPWCLAAQQKLFRVEFTAILGVRLHHSSEIEAGLIAQRSEILIIS
jgi:hypothetical protein